MKYSKKRAQWENSAKTCTYNPIIKQAYSYGWWRFVEKIGSYLVFNNYNYSPTTNRHQRDIRKLIGYKTKTLDIQARKGLQDLDTAIEDYKYDIKSLLELINKPKTHASKNAERRNMIKEIEKKIELVQKLIRIKTNPKLEQFNEKLMKMVA